MLKLYGFCISNYYNKNKLALLEKGIPFEEVNVKPSQEPEVLQHSPLGKVPYLLTDKGALSESHVIAEYLEDISPEVPLLPADPFARAKHRELIQYLELHIELVARRLYPEAFFGGKVSDDTKAEVRKQLQRNLERVAPMLAFAPYAAGDRFSAVDCAAWVHFPLVSRATKSVYGEDMLASALGADKVKAYMALINERPHAQKVADDRKQAAMAAAA
jgi:glutathione S-transferase